MQIHQLIVAERKSKKRIGRGGKRGTYSGRGNKGQKARSGGNVNPLFEGGRSSLVERLKKLRGFKSPFPKKVTVAVGSIDAAFSKDDTVTVASLIAKKVVGGDAVKKGVKVVGTGVVTKALTIDKSVLLSASAKKAIEQAGGKVA